MRFDEAWAKIDEERMKARVILTQKELVKRINDQIEYKKQLSDEDLVGNARCLGAISAYNDALDMTSRVSESATETEEQQKCVFCHGKADLNDTTNSDFQINIDPVENTLDATYDWGNGYDYCNFPIRYCPMCGRSLSDE